MPFTQNGPRPDLAALPVNLPEGYIGNSVFPVSPVADKSGTIYYATVTADSAAQTGRSAGTAPTGTQISDSSTTYTAAEAIKRGSVTPDEAKQFGGIEKADEYGAKWAKRQVLNAIEGAQRTALFTPAASATFDPAKLLSQSQTALDGIRLYEGRTALVAATTVLKKVVQEILGDSKFGPVFARLISGSSPREAATGLNFEAWKSGLALFLGVDVVLAGASNIWDAGAAAGKFAFTKIDASNDPMSHKWMPVLGKTFMYYPDGVQPFEVRSIADEVARNNHYDALSWYNVVTLNSGAIYVVDGVA